MKNSVLDRLKSYFDEYFSDATKPTARNLFLIVVSVLTLDTSVLYSLHTGTYFQNFQTHRSMHITMRLKLTG